MKKNKNILIIFGIFLIVLCNSIVYGALNTDMFIDGDAYVRVDRNIRVTGIKVLEQTNGAYETYNCDYSKDTTSIQATLPSSDSFIVYEVTITNKGDIDYEVSNIVEESYSNSNIKYEIIDLEKGTVVDGETTHTFKIKLTTTENDSENKGTLVLKYTFEEWIPSLYNMVAHKSRSLDSDIDFGVAPTKETSGVYQMNSTKDDEYPVYYYRGIVENNNVSFAGFCWKAVRTTSTGGVKLIYNGVPASDGSCDNTGVASSIGTSAFNTSYNSKDDVSYVYDNGSDSTIKGVIDKWYSDNMVEYTEMLEDTVWCNDRSVYKTNNSDMYFGAYGRNIDSFSPSLICVNDNDKFTVSERNGNGKLIYPVALLTTDEGTLAGQKYKENNITSYLYTGVGSSWWSLSASNFVSGKASGFVFNFYFEEFIHARGTFYVRPSISIVSGTMIRNGNGSVSKPYKLVEDKITKEWTFDYTGGEQEFKVPYDGVYKVELWGADSERGSKGAYTSGLLSLNKNIISKLYLYVGQISQSGNPTSVTGFAYNGGGAGDYFTASNYPMRISGGAGSTDVRLINGTWDDFNSLKSRIMVAAGAGSCNYNCAGGGLIGYVSSDYDNGKGGTQVAGGGATAPASAGSFGKGGNGYISYKGQANGNDGFGGGSGYFGGGGGRGATAAGGANRVGAGGGGSSFISGHVGSIAIKEESIESNLIFRNDSNGVACNSASSSGYNSSGYNVDYVCSLHYSGVYFKDTLMIDGAGYDWSLGKKDYIGIPDNEESSSSSLNYKNGYAKITLIEKK